MAEAASAAASAVTTVEAAAAEAAAETAETVSEMAAAANAIVAAGAPGSADAAESSSSADGSTVGEAAAGAWRSMCCSSFAARLGVFGASLPCSASACAASELVASAVSSAEAAAPVAAGSSEVAVAEVAARLKPCWRRRFGKGRTGIVWERVEPSNSQHSSDPTAVNPSTELDTQPTLPSREEAAAMTAEAQAAVVAINSSIERASTAHTPAQLQAAAAELEAEAQTARTAAIGAGLAKVRAAAAHSAADAEYQRLAEERHVAYEAELSLLRCHGICMTGEHAGDRCNVTAAMFNLGLRQVGYDVSVPLRNGKLYCLYHRNQE